jgi:hypothetical protein
MKVGKIYLYIYGQLRKECECNFANKGDYIIRISKIHTILKWFVRLPKKYHYIIIKEMEDYGLIKKISQVHFMVIPISKIYRPLTDSLGNPLW